MTVVLIVLAIIGGLVVSAWLYGFINYKLTHRKEK